MESGSELGFRSAAQAANRGRRDTSESEAPGTSSEEESLPSENEAVRIVEAYTVTTWCEKHSMVDDADFSRAFVSFKAALSQGEAVAKAWQRARDFETLHGTNMIGSVLIHEA